MSENRFHQIKIRRRPWFVWLGWIIWLVLLIVFLEFGFGSLAERESQAAATAFAVAGIIFFIGVVLWLVFWFISKGKAAQPDEEPIADTA